MSAHTFTADWLKSPKEISDPGNAGTFDLANKGYATCAVKSAGAETRTVPAPEKAGQKFLLFCDTYGGDVTCTVTSGVSGLATVTLGSAGAGAELTAVSVGGTIKWTARTYALGTCTLA